MCRPGTNPAGRCLVAVVLSIVAAGPASRAGAGLVPGGGPQRSDCYLEADVQGIDNPGPQVRSNRKVTCTDGDACDTDGMCGNDSCTFQLALCISQADPNLPACMPPGELRRLALSARLEAARPAGSIGSVCGSPLVLTVPVRVRRNGRKLAGRVALAANATAAPGTRPARDRDKFVLQCFPRSVPCPGAVAPTTTTMTTPTSTTTTIAGLEMPTVTVGPGGAFSFRPETVRIRAGETVRWRWASGGHNVVSGSGGRADGAFCSPDDLGCASAPLSNTGATYEHTFTEPGTFPYFCSPHVSLGMTGRVIVEP